MAASLELTALPGVPKVSPGDDLIDITLDALDRAGLALHSGDVLVYAQKIVSKSENRLVELASVTPSQRAIDLAAETQKDARLIEVILGESSEVLRHRPGLIVVVHRLGFVVANAGVDSSNVDAQGDKVLLLPEDPDNSCAVIHERLRIRSGADVGVMINDSVGRAWRTGTVGIALGLCGVPAIRDLKGKPDLFGRSLETTEVAVADELAAAASLLQGQAAEATPIVHVRGFPGAGTGMTARALLRPEHLDLFR